MRRLLFAAGLFLWAILAAQALELGLPVACTPGADCFVQQFPDTRPGAGAADPFCGSATYDGHSGTDLRVLSMKDVGRGVAVTAVADGTVLRSRDGMPDRLVRSEEERAGVRDVECGNGLVLTLGDGYEAQYCHMKQDSIAVQPGDRVKRGERLGQVGASGMAQFPHVHVTIRKDGKEVDPSTGKFLDAGCLDDASETQPLFARDVLAALGQGEAQIVAAGLAGAPVDHAELSVSGPPPAAASGSPAFVAWGWFINLHAGDRVRIALTGPAGGIVAQNLSDPMDRSKASWSGFAGKRGAPAKGKYLVTTEVLRDGQIVIAREEVVRVD